ncbi:hypothetical protein AB833_01000 [Chromatiales bacterium (ex Bugula neritina AB1)]|nr:hypothetical protein AB833_01000 [Chromatiales bacterium (ex Bugula neritina AB1)]
MLKHPWIIIVLIPCSINLLLVGMYFSGIPMFQHIVVPNMPYVAQEREFGLLENLQNLYLLAMVCMGVYALKVKPYLWEKLLASVYIVAAAFIFMEEIDWGLHWIELLGDVARNDAIPTSERNWHNNGERTSNLKDLVTLSCVLLFVIAPFALQNKTHSLIRYVLPVKHYAAGFLGIVLISRLAHYLDDQGLGTEGMRQNISEFRELGMYYLYMIWSYTVIVKRSFKN